VDSDEGERERKIEREREWEPVRRGREAGNAERRGRRYVDIAASRRPATQRG